MRITPRDRSAYRVAAPAGPTHLIPLAGDDWALWRWVCVRAAGFPFSLLDSLASPALATAADALLVAGADDQRAGRAYATEFARSRRLLARAVHAAAAEPRFREAVAWQNRRALRSGIDALLRQDPDAPTSTARYRGNRALVASYLQRYCAKNETIGFFGPAGWAEFREGGPAVRLRPAPAGALAQRRVYFEGWAVRTLAQAYAGPIRPWLVPRRMPLLRVADGGGSLRMPFAPPVPIGRLTGYTLMMVDGARTAREIAAAVVALPAAGAHTAAAVYAELDRLREEHRIAWALDVAPDDLHPERTVRARLETVTDPALRAPGLEALDELEAARDAVRVAASAGDGRVAAALGALDDTFTRLTGSTATRRDGEAYAGRTLVYEDCLRGDELTLGTAALDALREPLALLLEAARWFTAAGAALVHRACLDIYRTRAAELGTNLVPLAEFWLLAQELIFHPPASVIGPLVRNLQDRWARILALPPGERRVTVHSAQLRQQVRDAFVVARPGWAGAVHHSPDLMLCTGDGGWVLGELHPGVNTLRYASRVAYHPDPGLLRRAAAADVGGSAVVLAPSAELGTRARQFNGLFDPGHPWLVFAHDTSGYDPARTLLVGDCDLVEAAGRLVVRHRSGRPPLDLIEVIADAVSMELTQHFKVLPPARHAPRVSLDALVVHRETWTFAPDELPFAGVPDESARFLAIRRWAGEHSLPRYAFVRATGERKPIFIDLASLASADLLSRAVRRARRQPDPVVTVTEMLPAPDQLWLTDAGGAPYTCELRICAVDRRYATSASR